MFKRLYDWLWPKGFLGLKDKHLIMRLQPDGTWRAEFITTAKLEWLKKTEGVTSVTHPDQLRQIAGKGT
jgi:hypothetical protein